MSSLPFRKVAILDPALVFGPEMYDNGWHSALDSWIAVAASRGADAVYARIAELPPAIAGEMLTALHASPLALIAPAAHETPQLQCSALHFRSRDMRPMARQRAHLLGRSCHSPEEVLQAQFDGFDYVFLSPIFSTATHPEARPLGLDLLAKTCREAEIPVIALGGLHLARVESCRAAGAAGIAGIRMFL